MELNGETLRFIREHCKDDVRSLALQAPKYPGVGYNSPMYLNTLALQPHSSPNSRTAAS